MNKIHKTTSSDPIAMVSSRLPIRLSPQQAEAIRSVVKDAGAVRMGHSEYMAVHRRLKSITVPKLDITRPALYLKNIAPGYSRSEFTLLPEFNPTTDIPEGYGVYSMHDGGANHKIGNAASLAWTQIWNFWSSYKEEGTYWNEKGKELTSGVHRMNIIMSYRQWESIGKKAGWRRDETDDNLPAGWPFGGVKKELFSTYLKDVDSLLQANYGTTANDTNAGLIQSCYGNGESPKECVTQIAEKYNLETLDPSVTLNTKQAANAEFVLWGRREGVPWTKLTNNTSHAEMKRRQKDGWEVVRQLKGSHPDDILKPPATTGAKKEIKQAAKPYDLLLRPVRVTFSDGDVMTTNINGSNEEIEQYYLTNDFVKDDETTMHHGVKVEFLDELSSAPDSIQDLILLKPFGIVLKAIKALGEESIAGFSGVTEADVPDVIRMCEPHELAEILQSIEKLEKLAEKTAGTIEKGKDVTDRQIITESKKATNCPRCGQRYQRHPDRAGHESIMQCPKCFLNYSPECESGQSAVYDPTTGTVKTGPTEKIFPPQPKPDTLRSRIEGA